MRLLSIASGSSGNCIYVGNATTHILIDAGISNRRIEAGLKDADLSMTDLAGIFVTHEHADHIQSLGILSRKYNIPIYSTEKTLEYIKNEKSLGDYDRDLLTVVEKDLDLQIGDLIIHPFSIYHDAADPVGFRISDGKKSVAVSTDIGHYDDYLIENLKNLSAILLEANHDVHMLEVGSYPYYLKRRILSDYGHLSNENSGKLLSQILNDDMEHILLGHLSKENNYPDLAYEAVRLEISEADNKYQPDDFDIVVASREHPSRLYEM